MPADTPPTQPAVPGGHARHIALNTVAAVAARVTGILIGLGLTPFLIHTLGNELYGLWAVVGSLMTYFGLLDLGFGDAAVRYVAEYAAHGDRARVRQVVTLGLLFYLLMGLALAPVAYLLSPWLIGLLKLSRSHAGTARHVFALVYGYYFLSGSLGAFCTLLIGLGRMRLTSWVGMASQVVYAVLVVILTRRWGLYGVFAASFAQLAVWASAMWWIGRRLFGPLWHPPHRMDPELIRKLFRFGGWMQLNNLSKSVNSEADRLIIGSCISVRSVTAYEIANKANSATAVLPAALLGALLPSAAAVYASDASGIDRLYARTSRYLMLFTLPISGFVATAAAPLVELWIGPGYAHLSGMIGLLILATTVNTLTGAASTILRVVGKPFYESFFGVTSATLNVMLTILLTPRMGLGGVILATVAASCFDAIGLLAVFHLDQRIAWWHTMGTWLWRLVLCIVTACGWVWGALRLLPGDPFSDRLSGTLVILGLGACYLVLVVLLLRFTGFIDRDDRRWLSRISRWAQWPALARQVGGAR